MDPLSVSASIVGILTAAAAVSSVITTFINDTKGAPKLAQTVLNDVNGLSAALGHLETYLLGAACASRSRPSTVLAEQLLVSSAECVATFSEFEEILGTSKKGAEMGALDRMKWASKQSRIADIPQRLQMNTSMLTLMLTVGQWYEILLVMR